MGAANILKPLIAVNIALKPMKIMPLLLARIWGIKISTVPQMTPGIIHCTKEKVINSVIKVEPILVPKIMPMVCVNVKLPAETSPRS